MVAREHNAFRLACLNPLAERLGLRVGQSLADARAAVPGLKVDEADPAADGALLEAVADWCDRYTPLVAPDRPDGLFLDISGCAHLFARRGGDGERALGADLLARLDRQGFSAAAAIAATAGAAWAMARHGGGGCLAAGAEAESLAPLPVAALRLEPEQTALLDRLGLKRIGDLYGKPRAPLAARFGVGLVRRLDQALGAEDEVLSPRRPAPLLAAERRFSEPLDDEAALLEIVGSLARTLAPALERHGIGSRSLELALFCVDGRVGRIVVGTAAPLRDPEGVRFLFRERIAALGTLDAGFGFETARLSVLRVQDLKPTQTDLSGEGGEETDVERLVDRLGARLGMARVRRLLPVDTHSPERAAAVVACAAVPERVPSWGEAATGPEAPPERPLRLFARPEPVELLAEVPEGPPLRFRWRRLLHEVARAEGPERIASEWWRAEEEGRLTRDYYRVEDVAGRRYWLFREGLYGREADRPAWYVHGLFA